MEGVVQKEAGKTGREERREGFRGGGKETSVTQMNTNKNHQVVK